MRSPASYRVDDLLRLRIVAELRREGAPLQRIRKAIRNLVALFPEMHNRPGSWRLAVLANGDVVRIGDRDLFDLTRQPGQSGWLFLLDAGEYLAEYLARAITCSAATDDSDRTRQTFWGRPFRNPAPWLRDRRQTPPYRGVCRVASGALRGLRDRGQRQIATDDIEAATGSATGSRSRSPPAYDHDYPQPSALR